MMKQAVWDISAGISDERSSENSRPEKVDARLRKSGRLKKGVRPVTHHETVLQDCTQTSVEAICHFSIPSPAWRDDSWVYSRAGTL